MECPGERTRFHRRHDENRKEVILNGEEEGCEEEEVNGLSGAGTSLGDWLPSAANPRLLSSPSAAALGIRGVRWKQVIAESGSVRIWCSTASGAPCPASIISITSIGCSTSFPS